MNVVLYGLLGKVQNLRDLFVREAAADKGYDLLLSPGQPPRADLSGTRLARRSGNIVKKDACV